MESNLSFEAEFVALCANASDSNATSELWQVESKTRGLVTAVILLVLVVVGLPWNLLVMVTILKNKLFKQPTILLLLNFIINDLLLIVITGQEIATGFSGEFGLGLYSDSARCALCEFWVIDTIFVVMSLYTVLLISFDRFLFIYKPLKYERLVTSPRMLVVLIVLWIFCILLSLLPEFGFGVVIFSPELLTCTAIISGTHVHLGTEYSLVILVIVILPLILLIFFNTWVIFIVQKNIRAIYKVRRSLIVRSNATMSVKRRSEELYKRRNKERHLNSYTL